MWVSPTRMQHKTHTSNCLQWVARQVTGTHTTVYTFHSYVACNVCWCHQVNANCSTLCLKKSMWRYLFEHNSNINCPIIIIFGTVVTETISYWIGVSFFHLHDLYWRTTAPICQTAAIKKILRLLWLAASMKSCRVWNPVYIPVYRSECPGIVYAFTPCMLMSLTMGFAIVTLHWVPDTNVINYSSNK